MPGPLRILSLKAKLFLLVGLFIVGLLGFAVVFYATLNFAKVTGPLYRQIVRDKDLLADVAPPPGCLLDAYLTAFQMCNTDDAHELASLVERYGQFKKDYRSNLQKWSGKELYPATRDVLLKETLPPAREFFRIMDEQLIPALQERDLTLARSIFELRLALQYAEHRDAIDNLVMRANQDTSAFEIEVASLISSRSNMLFGTGVVVAGLGCCFAFYIIRMILRQMEKVIASLNSVADGDLTQFLETRVGDEFGRLARAVNGMTASLRLSRQKLDANQQSLAAMNAQLTGVMNAATQISIIATDVDGLITVFNSGAENMFGYVADEMLGRQNLKNLYLPEEVEARSRQLAMELGQSLQGFDVFVAHPRQGAFDRWEWTAVRKNGCRLTVSMVVTAVQTELGGIIGFLAVAEDITARKQVEQQMILAREQAELAARTKSEFLANMSHEIRTPMNGIIGMTELALDTDLTSSQREYLETVQSSAGSLLRIINDILDFSKIEAGKLDLDPEPFLLRESLGDAIKSLGVRAHQKNLELLWRVPPEVPDGVIGDAGRLRQVLVNLVGNAIKFTESGEVAVTVDMESQTQTSVRLRFSVSDTGMGIPPDKQAMIFEAFAQADSSATRVHGGTGLGLSISRQIVHLMRGEIGVQSEMGRGSTFHFAVELPLSAHQSREDSCVSLEGIRVLVVDDNQTNRKILDEVLRAWKMRPILAAEGHAGLELIRTAQREGRPIPLVLTDCHMPLMDGFTFVEELRKQADLSGATIMMLTSVALQGAYERCRQLGIATTLLKPVKQSELHRAVIAALGRTASQPQTVQQPTQPPAQSTQTKPSGDSLRILLADDNPINRRVAEHMLTKLGYSVQVATNGQEAVQAVESHRFDVVLMDVQMPVVDGFEATATLREAEQGTGRRQHIIAMTAHAMEGDRERCLAAGMDDYVTKPIEVASLRAALDRAVASRRPAIDAKDAKLLEDIERMSAMIESARSHVHAG